MYPSSRCQVNCAVLGRAKEAKNSIKKEEDLRRSDGSRTADVREDEGGV